MAQYGQYGFFNLDLGPALNRRGVKARLANLKPLIATGVKQCTGHSFMGV